MYVRFRCDRYLLKITACFFVALPHFPRFATARNVAEATLKCRYFTRVNLYFFWMCVCEFMCLSSGYFPLISSALHPLGSFVSFPLPPLPVYRNFRYTVMLMRCECDDAAATSFLAYLSPLFLSKVLRQHRTEKCWVKGIGKAEGERLVAERTFGCYCFWMRSLPKLEKNMRTEYTEKNQFCNINKSRYYLA